VRAADGWTKSISSRAKTPIKQVFHGFQTFSRSLSLTAFVLLIMVVLSLDCWSSSTVAGEVVRVPEGSREPSGGRRLASAVVVRHGRCKASSRQRDISATESPHRRREPILKVHPIGNGEDPGKNHSSGSAPNGSLSEKAPLEQGSKGA